MVKDDGSMKTVPEVKICGLTREDEALACAELGARAIGFVFFPRSPRHVSREQARGICRILPSTVCPVGVFVDEDFEGILKTAEFCGLEAVQLHGGESPDLVQRLLREGLIVVKALFINGEPSFDSAASFGASAYLLECAGGPLPGGNAKAWDWGAAAGFGENHPFILAGGLNPENVSAAVQAAVPQALDVSSGVEVQLGRKDMNKVRAFLDEVRRNAIPGPARRIFRQEARR